MVSVYRVGNQKKSNFWNKFSVNTNIIILNLIAFVLVGILLGTKTFSQDFFMNNISISLENIQQLRLWTFFTSMFMHAGFFHLFANMFSLFFIGGLVQKILGGKRFLWFYMVAGLFASLLYIVVELFSPSGLGAVGASGALFGLVGFLVIITPNLPVYVMLIPIPIKMKYAGPGILILLWFISRAGNIPIGNSAHFGGLIVGVVYGFYLRNKYKNKTRMISRRFS